jgi:hypothetical protein
MEFQPEHPFIGRRRKKYTLPLLGTDIFQIAWDMSNGARMFGKLTEMVYSSDVGLTEESF